MNKAMPQLKIPKENVVGYLSPENFKNNSIFLHLR